jgi:hypothetical protein
MQWLSTIAWRGLALVSLLLGLIGVLLPGLPTVPFVLLSAFAAGKGWPAFEYWLLQHPRLGPPIQVWRQHGVVPRRAKWLASSMMGLSVAVLWLSAASVWLQGGVTVLLLLVAAWLWQRPEWHT